MVINFFGRRGCGKTTTIRGNIESFRRPVVIVDILGNFTNEGFYETQNLATAVQKIREFKKSEKSLLPTEKYSVIVLRTSDPATAADYLSSALWHTHGGTLVLDEVDSIRVKEGSCFDEFIRYGRNRNGDLITGCRRPAELEKNITAAANKFYCFQTHEPRDVEYFGEIFGDRADELLHMEKFSGLFIDHDRGVMGKFEIDIAGNIFHTQEESI